MAICEKDVKPTTCSAQAHSGFASELTCVSPFASARITHLISNPDGLIVPVMDLLFIIIAVTAF